MQNEITTIQQDAEKIVADVAGAVDNAEAWAEKILSGGIETRVLGGFATSVLNALKALKAEVDSIAARLGAAPPAAPAPSGTTTTQ